MTGRMNRRSLMSLAAGLPFVAASAPALAQARSPECEADHRLSLDFAYLSRYTVENSSLLAAGRTVRIVFMGDSITQGWIDKRPSFFTEGRVNRGIGGQTTPQMVLRMMADVLALKPHVVHIMAGTNDIAGNTGPMTEAMSQDNIAAMATLARAQGVSVLLASIPPAANFPWRPGLETRGPIARLNSWIRAHAEQTGATWIDYHPALADPTGAIKAGLAYDGVHPTEAGYDAMAMVLAPRLQALGV